MDTEAAASTGAFPKVTAETYSPDNMKEVLADLSDEE